MVNWLHFDLYARHKFIASRIENRKTVLDIGGNGKTLALFLDKTNPVWAMDLSQGQVHGNAIKPPFKEKSFDVVCCLDVIEHLPKAKRAQAVKAVVRIAKEKAIFSIPAGTQKHIEMEERFNRSINRQGVRDRWLDEHCRFGLPSKKEMESLFHNYQTNRFFREDFTLFEKLSQLHSLGLAPKIVNWCHNRFIYPLYQNNAFSEKTNRFYIEVFCR